MMAFDRFQASSIQTLINNYAGSMLNIGWNYAGYLIKICKALTWSLLRKNIIILKF
jgi:hypothetical protein